MGANTKSDPDSNGTPTLSRFCILKRVFQFLFLLRKYLFSGALKNARFNIQHFCKSWWSVARILKQCCLGALSGKWQPQGLLLQLDALTRLRLPLLAQLDALFVRAAQSAMHVGTEQLGLSKTVIKRTALRLWR